MNEDYTQVQSESFAGQIPPLDGDKTFHPPFAREFLDKTVSENFPEPVPAKYDFGPVHNRRNDENYTAGMLAEAKARDNHSKACLNIRSYLEALSDGRNNLDETQLALAICRVYAHKFLKKKFRIGGKKFDKTSVSWKGKR